MKVVSAQKGRQGRRRGEAPLVRLAWGLDLVTVLVAGIAAYIARFGLAGPSPDFPGPTQEYIGLLGLGLVLSILFIRLIKVNETGISAVFQKPADKVGQQIFMRANGGIGSEPGGFGQNFLYCRIK